MRCFLAFIAILLATLIIITPVITGIVTKLTDKPTLLQCIILFVWLINMQYLIAHKIYLALSEKFNKK